MTSELASKSAVPATTKLSVNVNKVATLRNTRSTGAPDVARCARICMDAGAHGITVHPRPDQRHIRPHDVDDIARLLTQYPGAELNIEGNPLHDLVAYAERVRPAQCTLVPDDPSQSTSDHGWDLAVDGERLRPIIARMRGLGCRVSLFMDAAAANMERARDLGADRIELYTEPYAAAFARGDASPALPAFQAAARAAQALGLGVNAGHDLSQENLGRLLAQVPGVLEVSIGHALIAEALELGLAETVRRYLAIVGGRAT
jgi:pyridoxine 5-phosphate synthase